MIMGFELLRQVVYSTILTGRLKGHDPISLLLIAPPERGKTSIVLERKCESIVACSDVTGKGLQELCKHHAGISHIVLTDMVTVMAHKASVSRYTVSVLNAITEEGLQGVAFPGSFESFSNGKRGIIGCLTPSMVKDQRCWWTKTGFASRMLPFNFEHPNDLAIRIKQHIEENNNSSSSKHGDLIFRVPKTSIHVDIPTERMQEIRLMADNKSKELGEIGYRRLKQFISLASAHAMMQGFTSPKVESSDTTFLMSIQPYVSYEHGSNL